MTTPAWPAPGRILGLQANASDLDRHALEHLDHADGTAPEVFGRQMEELHGRGMVLLGGCCGTGEAHIRAIADRLATATKGKHGDTPARTSPKRAATR